MSVRVNAILAALLPFALIACSTEDSGGSIADTGADASVGDGGPDQVTADTGGGDVVLPTLEEGWQVIVPGGDTICSRGTEYKYLVRPGTTNRLVVDFMGGGACWDEITCSFAEAIFNEDVEGVEEMVRNRLAGIYDVDHPENPFRDWYHVFIPYCTGDIHWGDAVTVYGAGESEVTINHKGAVNARAVLDWVEQNFSGPEQIFVTGCSAGAYGSIMWAPHIIEMYPSADVIQFGDSGAGIITDEFFRDSFPSWNASSSFPEWIPTLDPERNDILDLDLSDLYGRLAAYYGDYDFSQYNTAFDDNQTFYFEAMGGSGVDEWSARMRGLVEAAAAQADNFHYFVAPGEQHCIIPATNFYTVTSNEVRLVDWLNDLLAGNPVENVTCVDCSVETGE